MPRFRDFLPILSILIYTSIFICDDFEDSIDKANIQNEFIVQFKNYYNAETRARFLKAALDSSGVKKLKNSLKVKS